MKNYSKIAKLTNSTFIMEGKALDVIGGYLGALYAGDFDRGDFALIECAERDDPRPIDTHRDDYTEIEFGPDVDWTSSIGALKIPSYVRQMRHGRKVDFELETMNKAGFAYKNNNANFDNCAIGNGFVRIDRNRGSYNSDSMMQFQVNYVLGVITSGFGQDDRLPELTGLDDDVIQHIIAINGIVLPTTEIEMASQDVIQAGNVKFFRTAYNPVKAFKGLTYRSENGEITVSFASFRKANYKCVRFTDANGICMRFNDLIAMEPYLLEGLGKLVLEVRKIRPTQYKQKAA